MGPCTCTCICNVLYCMGGTDNTKGLKYYLTLHILKMKSLYTPNFMLVDVLILRYWSSVGK